MTAKRYRISEEVGIWIVFYTSILLTPVAYLGHRIYPIHPSTLVRTVGLESRSCAEGLGFPPIDDAIMRTVPASSYNARQQREMS